MVVALLGLLIAATQQSQAQTLTTLFSFNGTDGWEPWGGLVLHGGNLYGTTQQGGGTGWGGGNGVAFAVNVKKKTETVLYAFCYSLECVEGPPSGGFVRDSKGNLYGTSGGGYYSEPGQIYEITAGGTAELLYSFTGTPDGSIPAAPLIIGAKGNLYGTTGVGGVSPQGQCPGPNSCGTVFEWSPTSGEKVLYSFQGVPDGMWPEAGLLRSKSNFYGTTYYGGSDNCGYGCGIVFEVTAKEKEKVIYAFQGGSDGCHPTAGLIADKAGNFYGTTNGPTEWDSCAPGTVFELTTSGTERVLYEFCAAQNCADGANPNGGVVMDAASNLYGTTWAGGAYGEGTVFELSPQGVETVLYSFCPTGYYNDCPDGAYPRGSLVRDAKGNLYGVTSQGGAYGGGTVFKLTP